jgi:long-chain acyl-CoA synthetase
MDNTIRFTLPARFEQIVAKFGTRPSLSFVGEEPYSYTELNQRINALIRFLEDLGVQPGDKVAILSANMPNWGVAYFAITFMGAVSVPLLPDFTVSEIENIINHSETKAIFISEKLVTKLDQLKANTLIHQIGMEDFTVIKTTGDTPVYRLEQKPSKQYEIQEDDLAAIIYTSGTTGNPKGVMLSHKNISITAKQALCVRPVNENDRFLSILPLSHTYENTLGFVMPMLCGSSVYYLGKQPTPSVLLPALLEVKPTMIFAVPLIIE